MKLGQDMLSRNADVWGSKVKAYGIIQEDSIQEAKQKILESGWNQMQFYHADYKVGQFLNPDFEFPKVILVDMEGQVVFNWHPEDRDIEADINLLLKGEKLSIVEEVVAP